MKKIALFVLIFWAQQVFSEDMSNVLQGKLQAIRTMSAKFKQVVMAKKREVSRSSGVMALSRPGRFRWQTRSPMEQLVVADGKKLWVYDVDLEQVTVKKQEKNLGGTAALFLSGYDETLANDFNVTLKKTGHKEYFDLQAKSSKANFQEVKLVFEGDKLTGIKLIDQLGQHTDVMLSDIKNNPSLAMTLFQFKVPSGVDVIKQ